MTSSPSARRHAARPVLSLLVAAAIGTVAPDPARAQAHLGEAARPIPRDEAPDGASRRFVRPNATITDGADVDTLAPARIPGMVAVGDTVRLFVSRAEPMRDILVRADSGRFVVHALNAPDTVTYQRDVIIRAEVRRGDRRRGWRALGQGAGVGVVVGLGLLGLSIVTQSPHNDGLDVLVGIVAGFASSVIGTAVGGMVALTYTDLWVPFDPVTLRMLPASM